MRVYLSFFFIFLALLSVFLFVWWFFPRFAVQALPQSSSENRCQFSERGISIVCSEDRFMAQLPLLSSRWGGEAFFYRFSFYGTLSSRSFRLENIRVALTLFYKRESLFGSALGTMKDPLETLRPLEAYVANDEMKQQHTESLSWTLGDEEWYRMLSFDEDWFWKDSQRQITLVVPHVFLVLLREKLAMWPENQESESGT